MVPGTIPWTTGTGSGSACAMRVMVVTARYRRSPVRTCRMVIGFSPTRHCPARQRWSLVADALVQNLPELIAFLRDRQPSEIAAVTTTRDRIALEMLSQAVRLERRRERTSTGRAAWSFSHHFATLALTASTKL